MKCLLSVCLVTLLATLIHYGRAQNPPMRQGVSVEMAATNNAVAVPEADGADAWIIAITADGRLYFGVKAVTSDQLFEEMKATPRKRDAKLFVKADARSTFASLKSALGPARSVEFEKAVLLTSQPAHASGHEVFPPHGIEVQIVPTAKPGQIDVRWLRLEQSSTLTVNGKTVAWTELDNTLKNLVRGPNQIVEVEPVDSVQVAEVIRVLDEARKSGAAVVLPMFHSI